MPLFIPPTLIALGEAIGVASAWGAARTAATTALTALPFSAKAGDIAKKGWNATKAVFTKTKKAPKPDAGLFNKIKNINLKDMGGKAISTISTLGAGAFAFLGVTLPPALGLAAGAAIIGAVALGGFAIYKAFSSDDKSSQSLPSNGISEHQLQTALAPALAPQVGKAPQPMMMNGMIAGGGNVASAYPAGVGMLSPQIAQTQNANSWVSRTGGSQAQHTNQVQSLMDRQAAEQMAQQQRH